MISVEPRRDQVWEARGTHAGLQVQLVNQSGDNWKVKTLKNSVGVGGKGKRRLVDRAWHIRTGALVARYRLVHDAEPEHITTGEERVTMTQDAPATRNNYQAAADAAFDALTDEQRREILQLRGDVPTGELCRTYSISKATLGRVIAWGIRENIAQSPKQSREEVPVIDPPTAVSGAVEVPMQHAQPVPVFDNGVYRAATAEQSEDWPAGSNDPVIPTKAPAAAPTTRYRIKALVLQPVEAEYEIDAASFSAAERQFRKQVENVHEVLGIEKVR